MFFNDLPLEVILQQALLRIPAILIGFTLHEFMHAYVAKRMGDPTAENHGRLTLNPLVHIDWLGFFFLMLAGFGWAKPVPTNPRNYKNYKKGRILVSMAGPLANLALAFIGFMSIYFNINFFMNNHFWYQLVYTFTWVNVVLFAFNMLPVPPLDGFTLVEMFVNPRHHQKISAVRNYGLFIIVALSWIGVLSWYIEGVFGIIQTGCFWIFDGIFRISSLF